MYVVASCWTIIDFDSPMNIKLMNRSSLFSVVVRCWLVVSYQCLRTTCQSHLQFVVANITAVTLCVVWSYLVLYFFHSRTVHLDIIKVFTPTDRQVFFKVVLKLTLKQLEHVSV